MLELNRYDSLDPINRPYTEDEQRDMDALTARQDELAEQYDALSEDDENACEEGERIEAELNIVTAAIQALETRTLTWDAQQMAQAGAFVILDAQGSVIVERGLIRPDSDAARYGVTPCRRGRHRTHGGKPEVQAGSQREALPAPERASHRRHPRGTDRATVRRACCAADPPRTGRLPRSVRRRAGSRLSGTQRQQQPRRTLKAADDLSASTGWNIIDAQRQQWLAALSRNLADLLPWLAGQDPGTTLLDPRAFCTGTLLDGVTGIEGPHAFNALSNALQLDMSRYWAPTRATYFDHVSKARIVEVAMQAVSPKVAFDLGKMKKGDASAAAEMRLAKSGWLPRLRCRT